ncbi:hypothetical protein LSTR_LSTR003154 [Laodelphax striatellus]|uniref:DDE Tnp4 domain-containing protein n=1 Tax=Laodelphax striatellus TaxID=195883 RepID=A0A482WVE4_LAOST|nr:hypothetical protein LSTR_LSTR003154 [Laodelphax striatellus]
MQLYYLVLFYRFLATGDRFQYIHFNHRVGATTAGKIVAETCTAIWSVMSPMFLMTDPSPEKWKEISVRFEELWNFPNCCGAIDGKHVRIEAPWNSGSLFFNYKSYHSIILQAVVDAEGKFVAVDVGEAGKHSDGGVFHSSTFGRLFNDKKLNLPKPKTLFKTKTTNFPYVFVADEAYALSRHMMTPFNKNSLTRERRIYNYRQSRARRIVECAFGMMAKKFRVFELAMLTHPDKTKIIVLACCVLHNVIRVKEGTMSQVYDEMMNIEVECDNKQETSRARAAKAAYNIRENFKEYFNTEGSVPWQDQMAFV